MTSAKKARELWESGIDSDAEIARRIGVSRQRVGQLLGPKCERGPNVVAELRRANEDLRKGATGKSARARGPMHGTLNMYRHYRCRCEACREANATAYKRNRKRRLEIGVIPPTVRHGRPATYKGWGCRCEACVAANSKYERESYRRRKARPPAERPGVEEGG